MFHHLVIFVLSSMLATVSLAGPPEIDKTLPFDVSDVSILLPLPDLKQGHKDFRLPFSDSGARGVLFSEANFKKLELAGAVIDDLHAAYRRSFITGIRLDPCAPQVADDADPTKCGISFLRLVGQVLEVHDGQTRAMDFGLHLIYAIKVDEAVIAGLQELKKDARTMGIETTGMALGVHPVFRGDYWNRQQALDWGAKLKQFVLDLAGEQSQVAASIMVTHIDHTSNQATWEWAKVPFDPATKRVLTPADPQYAIAKQATAIENVMGDHFSHRFTATLGDRAGLVSAKSTAVPELEKLLVQTPPGPAKAPGAYDAAYRIENPKALIIPQADCVSCHVATSYRLWQEDVHGKHASMHEFRAAPGITSEMEKSIRDFMATELYVVLNFAYFFTEPSISQRTVNESAEVARFLNRNFIASP